MDDTGFDQAASAIRFRAQVTGMPRAAIRAAMTSVTSVKPKSDPPPPKSRPRRNVSALIASLKAAANCSRARALEPALTLRLAEDFADCAASASDAVRSECTAYSGRRHVRLLFRLESDDAPVRATACAPAGVTLALFAIGHPEDAKCTQRPLLNRSGGMGCVDVTAPAQASLASDARGDRLSFVVSAEFAGDAAGRIAPIEVRAESLPPLPAVTGATYDPATPTATAVAVAIAAAVAAGGVRSGRTAAACVAVAWVATHVVPAARLVFVGLPLLGYFRWDFALLLALAGAAAARWMPRVALWCAAVVAASNLCADPRWYTPSHTEVVEMVHAHERSEGNASAVASEPAVTIVRGALSAARREAYLASTFAHAHLWTHATDALVLGYSNFGPTRNFDRIAGARALPFWSVRYGFRDLAGNQGEWALGRGAATRAAARRVTARWDWAEVERAIASALGVGVDVVVMMGVERRAGKDIDDEYDVGPPSVQVMLSSIVWQSVVRAHADLDIYLIDALYGEACDPRSLRSFIWPLIAPPGAGLLVWEGDGGGGARERRIVYEPGSMYVFRGSVVHAWAPWPYRSAYRVNLQAFAVRCGERWYVYH